MSFFIDSDIEDVIAQTSSELNYLIGKRFFSPVEVAFLDDISMRLLVNLMAKII